LKIKARNARELPDNEPANCQIAEEGSRGGVSPTTFRPKPMAGKCSKAYTRPILDPIRFT